MNRFAALLCFTLVSLSSASTPFPVLSEECNTTDFQAGIALEEINKDREGGFLLSLYRVFDAHRQHTSKGDIFYLTFDVLETTSSVLTRKSWKDAEIRPVHQTVCGRCKAVIYLSLPWRQVNLYAYNCTLSTVPPRLITSMCPDCPLLATDLDSYVPRAEEMVLKYNSESNHTHAFKLKKVEKASMQWMAGASYFAEFTIMETNCPRLEAKLSHCEFLPADQAHVGFCTGSVISRPGPGASSVHATCDIYDPKKACHPHPKHHDHHGYGHRHGPHHHHHHHHHHDHDGQNQTHSHGEKHQHHHDHDGQTKPIRMESNTRKGIMRRSMPMWNLYRLLPQNHMTAHRRNTQDQSPSLHPPGSRSVACILFTRTMCPMSSRNQ